jgi:hypothetical protein
MMFQLYAGSQWHRVADPGRRANTTTWRKLGISSFGAALAVCVAPIAWSAFGTHGCFCDGRCAWGNDVLVRIQGDG